MNGGGGGGGGGGAVPTGCYKCGRPGHWSRDCPSSLNSNNSDSQNPPLQSNSEFNSKTGSRAHLASQKPKQKPQRRTRPKLTPDLLLSDAGIGHILRYFPKAFKFRGRGHEVNDLQHLLHLYAEWHSRLLPYYNLDQFIHKVEQVAATKRVKLCLGDLREKIASGVDPTKLHEPEDQQYSVDEHGVPGGLEGPSHLNRDDLFNEDMIHSQEIMPPDIWEAAVQETTSEPVHVANTSTDTPEVNKVPDQGLDSNAVIPNGNQMSEEERTRMEANRLKALERAAARSRALRAS